jgi:hypothetical protein
MKTYYNDFCKGIKGWHTRLIFDQAPILPQIGSQRIYIDLKNIILDSKKGPDLLHPDGIFAQLSKRTTLDFHSSFLRLPLFHDDRHLRLHNPQFFITNGPVLITNLKIRQDQPARESRAGRQGSDSRTFIHFHSHLPAHLYPSAGPPERAALAGQGRARPVLGPLHRHLHLFQEMAI